MMPEELELHIGGPAGYLGPVGIAQIMTEGSLNGLKSGKALDKLKGVLRDNPDEGLRTIVVVDLGLQGRKNLVAGANKLDYHYKNVTPGRDFTWTVVADIRNVNEGELDPVGRTAAANRQSRRGRPHLQARVQVHGVAWTRVCSTPTAKRSCRSWAATASASSASSLLRSRARLRRFARASRMRSPQRPLPTSTRLPPSIAPFEVVITVTNVREAELLAAGERIAADLTKAGVDVLLDDRDERAGVKFKDAELIGVPYRVNIGKKLAEGKVEVVDRLLHTSEDVTLEALPAHIQSLLAASKR